MDTNTKKQLSGMGFRQVSPREWDIEDRGRGYDNDMGAGPRNDRFYSVRSARFWLWADPIIASVKNRFKNRPDITVRGSPEYGTITVAFRDETKQGAE